MVKGSYVSGLVAKVSVTEFREHLNSGFPDERRMSWILSIQTPFGLSFCNAILRQCLHCPNGQLH